MNYVRLGYAHILVAHSSATELTRRNPFWPRRSERTRTDAMKLALDLAEQLAENPTDFEKLAGIHSDDRASRGSKGVLGVVAVNSLPESVVDALVALRPGDVSRVVESELGFHIVRRDGVPPEQRMSARRILVQHNEVPAGHQYKSSTTTRARAHELIHSLARRLRVEPDKFGDLAREHSDSPDAVDGGDIGVWSSYDGSDRNLLSHGLVTAKIGDLVGPIDTVDGYLLYRRVPVIEREDLVVSFFTVPTDEQSGSDGRPAESAVDNARAKTHALAAKIGGISASFDEERARVCGSRECPPQYWVLQRGRNETRFVEAIEKLPIGSVALEPLETASSLLIVRREPAAAAPREPRFETEVPVIEVPSIEWRIESFDSDQLAAGTLKLLEVLEAKLDLEDAKKAAFRKLYVELAERLRKAPVEQRSSLLQMHRERVQALIGPMTMVELNRIREAQWRAMLRI